MNPMTRRSRTARRLICLLLLGSAWLITGCAQQQVAQQQSREYAFWPPPPDQPRIQFLVSYRYSSDVEPPTSAVEDLIYGKEGRKVLPINKPYGVAMAHGKIYVCDIRNAGVLILDLVKQQTRIMGQSGAATLGRPSDIAIAPDGMMYVADNGRNRVFVYDAAEQFVTTIGHDQFKPVGLAVFGDELYVADFIGQCIEVFDRHTGRSERKIGGQGMDDGQFIRPLGVATDSKGNIYVSDTLKCRVQRFNPKGELTLAFGKSSDAIGDFVRPKQIAVDADGYIYVVDAAFHNVQVFDQEGKLLTFFGSAGTHPGAMYLPVGVAVDEDDLNLFKKYIHPAFDAKRLVVVTNQFGPNKVSVYALGGLAKGATVDDLRANRVVTTLGVTSPDQQPSTPVAGPDQMPPSAAEPKPADQSEKPDQADQPEPASQPQPADQPDQVEQPEETAPPAAPSTP